MKCPRAATYSSQRIWLKDKWKILMTTSSVRYSTIIITLLWCEVDSTKHSKHGTKEINTKVPY